MSWFCPDLHVRPMLFAMLGHLAASNPHFNTLEYLEAFGNLRTNLERVNYIYDDLKKYNLFPDAFFANGLKGCKNESFSQECRQKGNKAFDEGDSKEALRFYTCSISAAESAKNLTIGYANRSAILLNLGRYQDCLVDIERALANNYPDHSKSKLFTRRSIAKLLLNISKPLEPYHQDIPEIAATEKHPTISSAKNCIKIESNERFGRHIIATRDIQIGETICVEKPYACVVMPDTAIHCHACLELCYNPIPCDNCYFLCFCSEHCKNAACDTFHKYECSALAFLLGCGINYSELVAIRVAILARDHNSSELRQEKIYRSDRYKEISNLMKGTDKLKVEKLYQLAATAAVIYHGFLNHTSFFEHPNNYFMENQFKENILSQLLIVNLNEMLIYENVAALFEHEEQAFAHGLYSFASLFNHSCCPNVESIQYGSTMVLKTINTIKAGQQCFVSYGPLYWNSSRIERLSALQKLHYFECKCLACMENWGLREDEFKIEISRFLDMTEPGFLTMINELTNGSGKLANKYLPRLIPKLKMCEQLEPAWDNVPEIKRFIAYAYNILGNKRLM